MLVLPGPRMGVSEGGHPLREGGLETGQVRKGRQENSGKGYETNAALRR